MGADPGRLSSIRTADPAGCRQFTRATRSGRPRFTCGEELARAPAFPPPTSTRTEKDRSPRNLRHVALTVGDHAVLWDVLAHSAEVDGGAGTGLLLAGRYRGEPELRPMAPHESSPGISCGPGGPAVHSCSTSNPRWAGPWSPSKHRRRRRVAPSISGANEEPSAPRSSVVTAPSTLRSPSAGSLFNDRADRSSAVRRAVRMGAAD